MQQAVMVARGGEVCFWRIGDDIYRTTGTVPGVDVYGLPMGRRFECSTLHWERFRGVYTWAIDVETAA
ncbi:MAG: hypothetical protein VW362_07055 [Candidatus Nanopelagicales bacterium]